MHNLTETETQELHHARWELLEHINAVTDKFMTALAFVWLGLLVIDFTRGLNPLLQTVSNAIWVLFIADFVVEFIIAPKKRTYLRQSWLTALSLLLPALRILRIFRAFRALNAARAVRTVSFVRLLTSLNRGMRATARALGRRNIGYVVAFTILVTFAGAAGIALFESPQSLYESGYTDTVETTAGLADYSEAVWWTAMLITTIGSDYWPQTVEGRILCWMLSVYALAIFGYITAALASHFIGIDRLVEQSQSSDDTRSPNEQLSAVQAKLDQLLTLQQEQTDRRNDSS
jgi:voltage-gated potassium channel